MKIVVTGPPFYNYSHSAVNALQSLGHDVCFFPMLEFYKACSYMQRKMFKCGCHSLAVKYNQKWEDRLVALCEAETPDLVLVLNGIMLKECLLERLKDFSLAIWLWDSIQRYDRAFVPLLKYFGNVFVFEKEDIFYLAKQWGIQAVHLPVGFDGDIYHEAHGERDVDISFIGIPDQKRLAALNAVAELAAAKGLKMKVCGDWYDRKYFWKALRFKKKNPYLFPYIDNRIVSAQEAAELYRRSKICLNINTPLHKSINPRTFEILATKSFQLMDRRESYDECVSPGEDLGVYEDEKDLLTKIEFYLANEQIRENMAEHGFQRIKSRFSMIALMDTLQKIVQEKAKGLN